MIIYKTECVPKKKNTKKQNKTKIKNNNKQTFFGTHSYPISLFAIDGMRRAKNITLNLVICHFQQEN